MNSIEEDTKISCSELKPKHFNLIAMGDGSFSQYLHNYELPSIDILNCKKFHSRMGPSTSGVGKKPIPFECKSDEDVSELVKCDEEESDEDVSEFVKCDEDVPELVKCDEDVHEYKYSHFDEEIMKMEIRKARESMDMDRSNYMKRSDDSIRFHNLKKELTEQFGESSTMYYPSIFDNMKQLSLPEGEIYRFSQRPKIGYIQNLTYIVKDGKLEILNDELVKESVSYSNDENFTESIKEFYCDTILEEVE